MNDFGHYAPIIYTSGHASRRCRAIRLGCRLPNRHCILPRAELCLTEVYLRCGFGPGTFHPGLSGLGQAAAINQDGSRFMIGYRSVLSFLGGGSIRGPLQFPWKQNGHVGVGAWRGSSPPPKNPATMDSTSALPNTSECQRTISSIPLRTKYRRSRRPFPRGRAIFLRMVPGCCVCLRL
jgi:hypothetical protein